MGLVVSSGVSHRRRRSYHYAINMAATSVVICNSALTKIGSRRITSLSDTSKEARVCNDNYEKCRLALLRMHPWNFALFRVAITGTTITNAVDNGSGLILITATAHGFTTGNSVTIQDVQGTQEANGNAQTITVVNANSFTIDGSTFANTYVSGGLCALAAAYQYAFKFPLPTDLIRVVTISDASDYVLTANEYRIESGYILTDVSTIRLRYVLDEDDTTLFDPLFDEALAAYLASEICYKIVGSMDAAEAAKRDFKRLTQNSRFVDSVEDPSVALDTDEWIRSRFSTNQGYVRDPMT